MTPKEKALELFDKMFLIIENKGMYDDLYRAKQCALIAVDEILESLGYKKLSDSPYTTLEARQYYVQVKQEIEKL
jgi:hypothetical protein